MKDGLYWPAAANEPASPFGSLVAEADAEGYDRTKGAGPHPFHGYYFRILTRQGKDAPGGEMDYMSDGHLTGGFALVAYPQHWDQSGIMTFIVNQDGKVLSAQSGRKDFPDRAGDEGIQSGRRMEAGARRGSRGRGVRAMMPAGCR